MYRIRFVLTALVVVLIAGPAAAQLAVTVDQTRVQEIPGSSLVVVPLDINLDDPTQIPSSSDLLLWDNRSGAKPVLGDFGVGSFVPGAPDQCEKVYFPGNIGNAENRYMIQRVTRTDDPIPNPSVRLLMLFDNSGSVSDQAMPVAAAGGKRLAEQLLQSDTYFSEFGGMINSNWFAGDREQIKSTVPRSTSHPNAQYFDDYQTVEDLVDSHTFGDTLASTELLFAVPRALKQLENAADDANVVSECGEKEILRVLVTFTDGVEKADPGGQTNFETSNEYLNCVGSDNCLLFTIDIIGENPGSSDVLSLVGYDNVDTSKAETEAEAEALADLIVAEVESKLAELAPEDNGGMVSEEYFLYYCSAYRENQVDTDGDGVVDGNRGFVEFSIDGQIASASFVYDAGALEDGCFLWDFDLDKDCRMRNSSLGGISGFDDYTIEQGFVEETDPCVEEVVPTLHPDDEDCSGCIPSASFCEMTEDMDCTGKFGPECIKDTPEGYGLAVDYCDQIPLRELMTDDGRGYDYWETIDEPDPAEQDCEDDTGAGRPYCSNGIDEDCDGEDTECPMPPIETGEVCTDDLENASPMQDALARENVFVVPLVRGGDWATDVSIIAKGEAPVETWDLDFSECCWTFNCDITPNDNNPDFDGFCCDQNGDGIPDPGATECFRGLPWVELYFIPSPRNAVGEYDGSSTSSCDPEGVTLCLGSDGILLVEDVMSLFPNATADSGSLVVSSAFTTEVEASSRTFFSGGGGTFGQAVPAIPKSEWMSADDVARLYHLDGECDDSRETSFGIVNITGTDVTFRNRFTHADGTPLCDEEWNVAACGTAWQEGWPCGECGYDVYVTTETFEAANAQFIAWAFVRDTGTNDTFFVTQVPEVSEGEMIYVPDAAKVVVSNLEGWMTDLEIANLSRADSGEVAQVTYWMMSDPNNTVQVSSLQPGMAYRLIDVVNQLGTIADKDTLVIQIDSGIGMSANGRTYHLEVYPNQAGSETFGQFMAGIVGDDLIGADPVYVPLRGGDTYRSKLYIANTSDAAIDAEVTFYGAKGGFIASKTVSVAAGNTKDIAGVPDNKVFYAKITAPEASVFAYGSIIDENSNDPIVILAR